MFIRCFIFCAIFAFQLYSGPLLSPNGFTNPAAISSTLNVTSGRNVNSCYMPGTNSIYFTWADHVSSVKYGVVYYAVYSVTNGTFTTPPTPLPGSPIATALVFSCYSLTANQVVMSWGNDTGGTLNPYFAVYDAINDVFIVTPQQIGGASYTQLAYTDVTCCYNPINNEVVFAWTTGDVTNPDLRYQPYYAIYDMGSYSFTTPPTLIPGAPDQLGGWIFLCHTSINAPPFNPSRNQVIFSWATVLATNPSYYIPNPPFGPLLVYSQQVQFSVYDAGLKTFITEAPVNIPNAFSSEEGNAYCCYNLASDQAFFTWIDYASQNLYYASYSFDATTGQPILGSNTLVDPNYSNQAATGGLYTTFVSVCANNSNNQLFFSWITPGLVPYYSILDLATASTLITSPINAGGYANGALAPPNCNYISINNQIVFTWPSYYGPTGHKITNPYFSIFSEPVPTPVTQQRLQANTQIYSPVSF